MTTYLLPKALPSIAPAKSFKCPLHLVYLHLSLSNTLREERKDIQETFIIRKDNHNLG